MRVSAKEQFKKIHKAKLSKLLELGAPVSGLAKVFGVSNWALSEYMRIHNLSRKTADQYLDENKDLVHDLTKTTKHSDIVKIFQDEYPRLTLSLLKKWLNRNKACRRMEEFGFITMADFIQNKEHVMEEVVITIAGVPRYKVIPISD